MWRALPALFYGALACGGTQPPPEEPPPVVTETPPSAANEPDLDAGRFPTLADAFMIPNLPFTDSEQLAQIRVRGAACFRSALDERDLDLALPRLRFVFDKTGTLTKVKVLCSTLPKKLDACVKDIFLGIELPDAASKQIDVGPECPKKK